MNQTETWVRVRLLIEYSTFHMKNANEPHAAIIISQTAAILFHPIDQSQD